MPAWARHLYYKTECVKTTWKLRIGVLTFVILAGVSTHGFWIGQIGRSLVCTSNLAPSDVILIENFDPDYLLFERAEALQKAGFAPRILVPVQAAGDGAVPNLVSKGIAEVMARQARVRDWDMIAIQEIEPISLNAAAQIRDRLRQEHVRSLIVITPGFRSRRSALVYGAVLGRNGTDVRCEPVIVPGTERWSTTWHGIQKVAEEFLKLQYYRFYVLPFLLPHAA